MAGGNGLTDDEKGRQDFAQTIASPLNDLRVPRRTGGWKLQHGHDHQG